MRELVKRLPQHLKIRLVTIILLFSIGSALFPVGLILDFIYQPLYQRTFGVCIHTVEGKEVCVPDRFETWCDANLTIDKPTANFSMGYSDAISIQYQRTSTEPNVTLRLLNSTGDTFIVISTSNVYSGNSYTETEMKFEFWTGPSFTSNSGYQNYTLQIERTTQDTMFRCWIETFIIHPTPPPVFQIRFGHLFWVGLIFIITGISLASDFVKETKELLSE